MQLEVRVLTPNEHAQWDALIDGSEQGTIFSQRWWIDIVTQGQGRLLGCFTGARLLAGLPAWPSTTLGISRLRQPPLTPYWGPIFGAIDGGYTTRLNTEMSVLRAFAEVMKGWADITMQCHPTMMNWLPFFWQGYEQTTRYTYRIERLHEFPLQDESFQKSIRQKLRLARQHGLEIRDHVGSAVITDMFERTMARQGLKGETELLTIWPQLAAAATERGQMFSTAVYDGDGNVHTARAMVWDARCAYAIFGGSDPRYRQSGAAPYSLVHEMQVAASLVTTYDFEGSTIEPIEAFFRSFGGTLTPYLMITRRGSPVLNAARSVKSAAERLKSLKKATAKDENESASGAAA